MQKRNASKQRSHGQFVLSSLLVMILMIMKAGAQSPTDVQLVKQAHFYTGHPEKYYQRAGNSDSTLQTRGKSAVARYNPVALVFKGSMFLYQHLITRQLARNCPYEITCSNFSKHAIHEFGIVKGAFLTADRIMRCNRISLGDVSPLDINEHTGTITDDLNNYR